MKKFFIVCLFIFLVGTFFIVNVGCNKQLIDLNYKFTKVHIIDEGKCYEIKTWRDYDDGEQIQINFKDYGTCLFHSNQIVLVEGKCPYCEGD